MEEAKEKKNYKRLVYKQFVQVSGLCGPQFLSYSPKRFTQLCRAFYAWRRAHKHIFYYLKCLYCWKSRGETFFRRGSIPILVSRTMKTQKFKKAEKNFLKTGLPPLISRSGWPHPPPFPPLPPPYLMVWIRHCITRVVFKLGSKVNCVCYGFATPHGDWLLCLTKHGPVFQQKRSKTKTNRDLQAHALALCASMVHVIASNSGWFMSLFAPVVIGQSSFFGFGFTKLTWPIFDTNYLIAISCPYYGTHAIFLLCRGPKHSFPLKRKTYHCNSFKVQAASFCKKEGYHFCILTSAIKIVYSPCVTWPKIARNFGIHMTSRLALPLALSVWLRDNVMTRILMPQFMIKT